MTRIVTIASVLVLLALPLAACSDFDPMDLVDNIFSGNKKPLPGDRKPLFPSGTPGVQQGVPPDLVKGYQPAPDTPPATAQAVPDEDKPKPKAKPKSKPKVAAPAAAQQSDPTTTTAAAPAATRPAPTQGAPWPDTSATRQTAAPAWPDPPAPTR